MALVDNIALLLAMVLVYDFANIAQLMRTAKGGSP
jgi:hypothetical protein